MVVSNVGVGGYVGYWGCEPRLEGIVQCTKRVGDQGGCERRIEVFVKIQKKIYISGGGGGGGGRVGVRVDVWM